MKSQIIKLIAALAIAASYISPAHAATVQFNSGMTAATGITGLDVSGTVYDVDFTGSFTHNEWATMLDVTSLAEATTVIEAIATALDGASVTLVEYSLSSGSVFAHNAATLYYGTTSTDLLGVSITSPNWSAFTGSSTSPLNNAKPLAINLTVSTIPVPAAVWLFGSGLLSLIGIARRKKAA